MSSTLIIEEDVMYVRETDHVRALALIEAAAASGSRADLITNVMPVLRTLMHADEASYADLETRTGRVRSSAGFPTPPTALPDAVLAWEARPCAHPWVAHVTGSRRANSVRLSDLCSTSELHRSRFYQDFYRPRGVEYADYQVMSMAAGQTVGFGVCRRDRDFSSAEHDLFEHLRRPLGRIWQLVVTLDVLNTQPSTASLGTPEVLTPAERRVSELVLRGWRTAPIAQALGVSPKAIEQHLTRMYRKTGVISRAEYIARSREHR